MNTKTFFSKQLVILSLLISFFSYANSPKVEKIIQTSEFKNFAKFHKLSENEIVMSQLLSWTIIMSYILLKINQTIL